MTSLVIDASVAIKWVVGETGTDDALSLRRHNLYAPDLLVSECANVLWKKVRRGELHPDEAQAAAQLLERADLHLEPSRRLMRRTTELAITLDHPAYDCLYLALAESLRCDFVTADERLRRRVADAGLVQNTLSPAQAAAL
ncbi:MAG: type II toxin-antitoxin system VapC family toxin [Proteobacteria bacterium]|nr:type II toxin-antitoxin system VapC family toxin [Pseudomonadota bacterium]MDA1057664.1 type II toxin-antitoxin system VapC family toxin [Pseudomonadota bacterium]